MAEASAEGENLYLNSRRYYIATILLDLGWSYFARNMFSEARNAFLLGVRSYKREDREWGKLRCVQVRLRGYAGLLFASRELNADKAVLDLYEKVKQAIEEEDTTPDPDDKPIYDRVDRALIMSRERNQEGQNSCIRKAEDLRNAGRLSAAKDVLLEATVSATKSGDKANQYAYLAELSELAMNDRD